MCWKGFCSDGAILVAIGYGQVQVCGEHDSIIKSIL